MEVGIRVVRGPDWQWRNQDDGEGHLGTVVEIGRSGSSTSPFKTVVVQWDSGSRTNYRVGYQDKYDLRIFDNASIGVRHPNVICDNCKKRGIQGMRWKCTKCFDFDLCTSCYMVDKHDLTHQFMRYENSSSQGVLVPKRANSIKINARGIFKGAIVVRGTDWEWQDQDGGAGKTGKVLELRGWDRESGSSVACVEWSANGTTNVYRVGHKGKVDLKSIQEGAGGMYYRDHLAILGMNENSKAYELTDDICNLSIISTQSTLDNYSNSASLNTTFGSNNSTLNTTINNNNNNNNSGNSTLISTNSNALTSSIINDTPSTINDNISITNNINNGLNSVLQNNCTNNMNNTNNNNNTLNTISTNNNNINQSLSINITENGNNLSNNNVSSNENNSIQPSVSSGASSNTTYSNETMFSVGDKVKIAVSLDIFKKMQEGHGGWNYKMADLIGKIGIIHRVTDKGDIRVSFDGPDNRWTIFPGALTKLSCSYLAGDYVRINSDEEIVKNLQKGHGEWSENMRMILGRICRITTVYGDGDLRVTYNGLGFTINASCCSAVPKHQADIHNTIAYHNMEDAMHIASQFKNLIDDDLKIIPESPDQFVRDSAHGNFQSVKDILSKFPGIIDQKSSGKTALQVSCHQGHIEIVKYLISMKANLEIQDSEGDTSLHYACFGNQPEILELLIQKNCNINSLNKNGCSALHVAVNKQHINCIKVLIKYKCDVNNQDSYGDTALHDIISKETSKETKQIIELLLSVPSINLSIRNKRGFNTLHHASLKGNSAAIEKLIAYSPQLVDSKKDDGFSAFHLAALNGHKEVVKCLLQTKADKEILNNRRQTPLLLSVAQLHAPIIELLVEKKANVNASDEDGDTCLHLVLNEKLSSHEPVGGNSSNPSNKQQGSNMADLKDCKLLLMISQNMPFEFNNNMRLIIASYLIQNCANLYSKNKHQVAAIDHVTDFKVKDFLQKQYLALEPQISETIIIKASESSVLKKDRCKLCDDEPVAITFSPCQHKLVCVDCSIRLKRCIQCNESIKEKLTPAGSNLNVNKSDFSQLLNKIQALEEAQICSICMERKKDTAFQCGHVACNICAMPLKACHICREKVVKKIKIYET